jgi:hypothetical protein
VYFGFTGAVRTGLDVVVALVVASALLRSPVCAKTGTVTNTPKTRLASSLRSFGDITFSFG